VLTTTVATPAKFSLARFVEDVRTLKPVAGPARHDWLPNGRTTLVFRVLDHGRRGDVCVAGPRTHARFKSLDGVTRAVSVQFKPGWSAPLLGIPANELTDRIVPLQDLWGRAGSELYAELLATRELPELLECVARALALRAQQSFEPASARLARRAARLLEAGEARVERVAEQLGVTARHLRRAFSENVGIGPKEFARAARLQRAVRMAESSHDWGRIATDAGYYDQAHFIAEFRHLIGLTPGAYLRRAGAAVP
jgi:AraC-like DNA-binding protein